MPTVLITGGARGIECLFKPVEHCKDLRLDRYITAKDLTALAARTDSFNRANRRALVGSIVDTH